MRKRLLTIATIILVVVSLLGCATWKSNTVTVYEATGTTIAEIGTTARNLCDQGTLRPDDCAKIKDIYNKTRLAYLTAGNALIAAINTEDAVVKQKNMDAYTKAIGEVAALVPQLVKLAGELGVTK